MITLRTLVCAGLCASLFSACQNDKRLPGSPVEYFGSVMPITGTEVLDLDSSEAFLPKAIAVRDSVVFVQCQGSKDVVISVDLRDNTRKVLLRKGNGPGEVLQMSAFSPYGDGKITAVESNKRYVIEISSNGDSVQRFFPAPKEYGPYISAVGGDRCVIFTGCVDGGMYLYYNTADSSVRFFGEYPVREEYRKLDNHIKSRICLSGRLAISPDHRRLVYVNYNGGLIDISAIRNDSIVNVCSLDFHYADVVIEGEVVSIRRTNKNGFYDVSAGNDRFCAIYSGKSIEKHRAGVDDCDYLMVFDWNGNPVACYESDKPLTKIYYQEDENVVYGVSIADDGAKLYKFQLL